MKANALPGLCPYGGIQSEVAAETPNLSMDGKSMGAAWCMMGRGRRVEGAAAACSFA